MSSRTLLFCCKKFFVRWFTKQITIVAGLCWIFPSFFSDRTSLFLSKEVFLFFLETATTKTFCSHNYFWTGTEKDLSCFEAIKVSKLLEKIQLRKNNFFNCFSKKCFFKVDQTLSPPLVQPVKFSLQRNKSCECNIVFF